MVGASGFEPPTPWSRTRCATRLRYAPTDPLQRERILSDPVESGQGVGSRPAASRSSQGSSACTRLPGTSASWPSSKRTQAFVPPS